MRLAILCITFLFLCGNALADPRVLVFSQNRGAKSYASMEVLKAAYARIGIDAMARIQPPGRALIESSRGFIDGDVHRVKGVCEKYPELIRIPVPVNRFEGVAFTCRDDIVVDGWESLADYRVGHLLGIVFAEEGLKGVDSVTVLPHLSQLFDLLAAGRLDVVVAVRADLEPHRQRLGNTGLRVIEPPLVVKPLYHFLNEKHASLVPDITRVLKQMEAEGEIERIREQALKDFWNQYPVE